MKITSVNIPALNSGYDGLQAIQMDRLTNVVLLAGKNGAGKTRILEKIMSEFRSRPTKSTYLNALERLEEHVEKIPLIEDQITTVKGRSNLPDRAKAQTQEDLSINPSELQIRRIEVNKCNLILGYDKITTDELADYYTYVAFVPKNIEIKDQFHFTKRELINSAKAVSKIGVEKLANGTFANIQYIQDLWFETSHFLSNANDAMKKKAEEDYSKLKSIIRTFLDAELSRSESGEATLFERPLSVTKLSDGQKIILQLCVAIYNQEAGLKNIILVLDEPENHLHPSVIIEVIERILACVSNGQLWIATHSIPLLAHFDPSQIWFVESGSIKHAGKLPEKVLKSLLGSETEIGKLQDFISLPAQLASSRYASECLFEPRVVETGFKDPQSKQIRKAILDRLGDKKIRILDYGVGKGRLISNLSELDNYDEKSVSDKIDYVGYDKFSGDKVHCIQALSNIYGTPNNRYFNDIGQLFSCYDQESFDIVIMCNVLHEIDPADWLRLFGANGEITEMLNDQGVLLLVEDHQIPIGEKAYQKGFLVLDTAELKLLFNIKEIDNGFVFDDARQDGRLKAHCIPKECLTRISASSRLKALKSLSKTAKSKILEIRKKDHNYQNGKLHGFWTQQFANAELNLTEMD